MTSTDRLEAVTDRLESLAEDLRSQLENLRGTSLHGPVDERELLTIPELAQVLGMGDRTLRRMRKRRDFPKPVRGPGRLRWRRFQVFQWMEKGR